MTRDPWPDDFPYHRVTDPTPRRRRWRTVLACVLCFLAGVGVASGVRAVGAPGKPPPVEGVTLVSKVIPPNYGLTLTDVNRHLRRQIRVERRQHRAEVRRLKATIRELEAAR